MKHEEQDEIEKIMSEIQELHHDIVRGDDRSGSESAEEGESQEPILSLGGEPEEAELAVEAKAASQPAEPEPVAELADAVPVVEAKPAVAEPVVAAAPGVAAPETPVPQAVAPEASASHKSAPHTDAPVDANSADEISDEVLAELEAELELAANEAVMSASADAAAQAISESVANAPVELAASSAAPAASSSNDYLAEIEADIAQAASEAEPANVVPLFDTGGSSGDAPMEDVLAALPYEDGELAPEAPAPVIAQAKFPVHEEEAEASAPTPVPAPVSAQETVSQGGRTMSRTTRAPEERSFESSDSPAGAQEGTLSLKLTGNMTLRLQYEFEGQEVTIGFVDGALRVELSDGMEFKIPMRPRGNGVKRVA